jgi:hypothetical protein
VLQEAANLHSFNKLESFELSECNLVTIKILDLLMKATNPLEWIWLTWKQREPKGFKKILCRWNKKMAKNHWNVRWTADYDEVSDVESEDEEITDSDEEISDVDSEEISNSDSEDSPAENSEESSSTDSNEELLIIDG